MIKYILGISNIEYISLLKERVNYNQKYKEKQGKDYNCMGKFY